MAGTGPTGKLQGLKATLHYTPPGSTMPVRFKSLTGWTMKIAAPDIDVSDHDSQGYADSLPGLAKVTVSVKGLYFEGDPSQQGLLAALIASIVGTGGVLACTFEPINAAGGFSYAGNFRVLEWNHSAESNNEAQKIDINLVNSGAITTPLQQSTGQ